ncbi:hypothetical protein LMG3410_01598 [Achromobacter aegrifaciens]|uniref:HNH nuclease domain-containing protein n=1 Tax=Achromobacter mucicolens TaxID=1389922 RepID=A0ABM8LK50_9BURK|nr:hypothetical protein MC81_32065 [Achromobacter insolitus]CAB3847574.1 hypothetical protein LMG3410_01598 [Achromobacter aegrifaciens]CAB3912534.1 hypothetical protein LMG3415_05050 [Achromobacter mucicolens]
MIALLSWYWDVRTRLQPNGRELSAAGISDSVKQALYRCWRDLNALCCLPSNEHASVDHILGQNQRPARFQQTSVAAGFCVAQTKRLHSEGESCPSGKKRARDIDLYVHFGASACLTVERNFDVTGRACGADPSTHFSETLWVVPISS